MTRRGLLLLLLVAACNRGDAIDRGRVGYERYCLACHGPDGAGDGPAARAMWPPPRDLRTARFKFAAAEEGELPRDAELARVIATGLHGTAMLAWDVPPAEVADIVAYVKHLSPPGRGFADSSRALAAPRTARDPFPTASADVLARGERLYHVGLQCAQCHPSYVAADAYARWGAAPPRATDPTASAPKWSAAYQTVLLPPDFRRHALRSVRRTAAGHDVADLHRVIAAGLQGAMPSYGHLDDADLWAVAHYVKTLSAAPRE